MSTPVSLKLLIKALDSLVGDNRPTKAQWRQLVAAADKIPDSTDAFRRNMDSVMDQFRELTKPPDIFGTGFIEKFYLARKEETKPYESNDRKSELSDAD